MSLCATLESSRAVALLSAAYSSTIPPSDRDSVGGDVLFGSRVRRAVVNSTSYRCYRTLWTVVGGRWSRHNSGQSGQPVLRQNFIGSVLVGLLAALIRAGEQSRTANWLSGGDAPAVEEVTAAALERFLRRASLATLAASVSHLSLVVLLRDGSATLVGVNAILVLAAVVGSLAPFSVSESTTYRLVVAVSGTVGGPRDDWPLA